MATSDMQNHSHDCCRYAMARRSKGLHVVWTEFIKDYLLSREALVDVLLLLHASIPSAEVDLTCAD